jgi:superfamily I DNA/RNA helicase
LTILLGGPLTGKTTRIVHAYREHSSAGRRPGELLCLSFFSANAGAIRQALDTEAVPFLPWVTTLQRFQTLLLRSYGSPARLSRRTREISPTARGLLLHQLWSRVSGPLWREYGAGEHGPVPGAVNELVRVIDWISENRTGFRLAPGELGEHELVQVYVAYIEHCDTHGLLPFQEASLRCLDLLADPEVAADVAHRFPVLLVDDLHLARPDQLALLNRLRSLAQSATATAWLTDEPQAPELRHILDALSAWGDVERLAASAEVNAAIPAINQRLFTRGADKAAPSPVPLELHSAFTVEDEAHVVAQSVARTLLANETLVPEDIAVIAPDADLLPIAQRVLAEYGLPAAAPTPAVRHTPLVRAALLALRWVRLGPTPDGERDLLNLPFVGLDPLDQHALYDRADLLERCPLSFTPDELEPLGLGENTLQRLEQVCAALGGLNPAQPTADLLDVAVTALGGSAWVLDDTTFPASLRLDWQKAFIDLLRLVRELEAVPGLSAPTSNELVDLVEQLTDQVALAGDESGIQLVPGDVTNGVRARRAYVIGLSENAAPMRASEMQLIAEADLPALFADGRPVVLPRARNHAAWLEREARRLAAMLTRGTERLWVSTSRYTLAGEAQLPSPFFERLLGPDGEIDRDGHLVLHQPSLWQWAEAPIDSPESLLPRLGTGGAQPRQTGQAEQLLDGQTFSATQLRSYLSCPLKFFYERVLRLETEGSGALDQGGMLHELLCATVGDGTTAKVSLLDRPRPGWMDDADALRARAHAALAAAWAGEVTGLPGGGTYTPSQAWGHRFGPELQRQAVRRWAERVLAEWADFEVHGLPDRAMRRPVLLEVPFSLELGGYRLRGRIDRIDEIQTAAGVIYDVIDYKTGTSNTGSLKEHMQRFLPEGDQAPQDFQLPLYALGLGQGIEGVQTLPRRVTLINVEAIEKTKRGGYSTKACRTLELVEHGEPDRKNGRVPVATLNGDIAAGIQSVLMRMSASPYPAQPGFHCSWCSFRSACERGKGQGDAP